MARSQSLIHFVGRGLIPLELKTARDRDSGLCLSSGLQGMVDMIPGVCSFYDMERYNPYAKEVRLELRNSSGSEAPYRIKKHMRSALIVCVHRSI